MPDAFPRSALAFLLAAALAASVARAEAEAWSAGASTQGQGFAYQIFSREDGGVVVYQARGRIESTPEKLMDAVRAVVADPARAPEGQSRRLVAQDAQGFTVYTHIDLPTFFSDRDIVTRGVGSHEPDTGRRRIDWKAIEHAEVPPVDGTIRISESAGFWDFVPDGDGASQAVYETYVDLGGSLPGWLVGSLMGGMVGDTFEDVAKEALGR